MNRSLGVAAVLVGLVAIACSSTSSTSPPGGPDVAQTPTTQTVGAAGGSVSAAGVVLTIPEGALAGDTPITVTPNAAPIPTGYTGLSPLYAFAPDGTVFQKPVTIAFTLSSAGTAPTVYWSNSAGGYDELPSTSTGTTVSTSIAHFSRGFVAEKRTHGDDAGTDSGPTDSGPPDSGPADSGPSDGAAPDGGASAITVTIDGVVTTFSANASVTLGASTTTIKADDNATSTHWTLQIVMTSAPQQACQLNGNPYFTYTHYTSGALDQLYGSKGVMGACILTLTSNPTTTGDHAKGTILSATGGRINAPTADPATHAFTNGTFDLTL